MNKKFQLLVIRMLLVLITHQELSRRHSSSYPVPPEREGYDAKIQKQAVQFIKELDAVDAEEAEEEE